jgi:hypothetical protein
MPFHSKNKPPGFIRTLARVLTRAVGAPVFFYYVVVAYLFSKIGLLFSFRPFMGATTL